eukprot:SAG31_NODE_4146_length_3533_cov_2.126674_1_plen_36_part_10
MLQPHHGPAVKETRRVTGEVRVANCLLVMAGGPLSG